MHYYRNFTLLIPGTSWDFGSKTGECDSREVIIEDFHNKKEVFSYGSDDYKIETMMLYGVDLWKTGGLYVGLFPDI